MPRFCLILIIAILLCSCGNNLEQIPIELLRDYEFDLQKVEYGSLFKNRTRIFDSINAEPADSNGVFLYMVGDIGYYHPVNLSFKALEAMCDYHNSGGDPRYLQHAINTMEALRVHAHRDSGSIWFPYEFTYKSSGFTYRAPWYSGMAQGTALSAYCRLYHFTSDPLYAAVADSILATFTYFKSPKRGVLIANNHHLLGEGKYYCVDEYPYLPNRFVLNGSIIGAMGLYDHWWVFGDEHSRRLFSLELSTVKDHVLKYRNPDDISAYCLLLREKNPVYHTVHVQLLRLCQLLTNEEYFGWVADLFESDHPI